LGADCDERIGPWTRGGVEGSDNRRLDDVQIFCLVSASTWTMRARLRSGGRPVRRSMGAARLSVDVMRRKRSRGVRPVSRRLLQTDAYTVALIFEFLETMLLHERKQLLDFCEIDSSRMSFLF